MKWFLNLSAQMKLFFGFGLMIILLGAVIFTAYGGITSIRESEKTLFEKDFATTMSLLELRADANRQRSRMLEMMLSSVKSDQETLAQEIRSRAKQIDEELQRLHPSFRNDPGSYSRFEELKTTLKAYRETRDTVISLISAGKIDEARNLGMGAQEERFTKIESIALELANEAEERARKAVTQSEQKSIESVRIFMIVGLIAVVMSLVMVVFFNQIMAKPLQEISRLADRVASGDLTVSVPLNSRADEVGRLTQTFRTMVENLRRVMQEIREGINVLASSASEIMASTSQVASGAAETATAVSQTTTTVEEVKQTAQVASQKAKQVSESAQKSAQVAPLGRKSVENSIDGMNRIQQQMESIADSIVRLSEQSQAIGEIIATVNDLAEQSNLLAVNAAIEAAKAGEQGKGFAVVAQEVKSLAEQSKQATVQVRNLLNDIQKATSTAVMATEQGSKAVETGVKQSTEAGESIRMLAENIGQAAQAATQIAASSQQQLVGMDQVALAMENIKQASMQNVASTKQAEISAQGLHELGQKLKQVMEQYRA